MGNEGKGKILHPGKINPRHQYMLEAGWLESAFAEKVLSVEIAQELEN